MKEINLNYGSIRDSIIRVLGHEILNESEQKTSKNFINEVRNKPIIHKQHLYFKNIENCKPFKKERLAERFLSQNLKMFVGDNWYEILKENKQIRKKYIEDSHVVSNGAKNDDLYNSMHTLLESITKPGFNDFNKEQTAFETVLNHLTREVVNEADSSKEKTDNPKFVNSDFILRLAVNNFQKRFDHLNESEKEIFKMILSEGANKTNYIEDLRKENLDQIEEKTKTDPDSSVLKEYKKKLENVDVINSLSKNDIILEFVDLRELLKKI